MHMSLAEARRWSGPDMRLEGGPDMRGGEHRGWSKTWVWAWPLMKTRAMEEEVKPRLSRQSWGKVWTRKEVEVWALIKEGWAKEEQMRVLEAYAWVQGEGWGWWMRETVEARTSKCERPPDQQTWAEGFARNEMRGEAGAMAEALALAGIWGWSRGEAHARGESVPFGLANSSTIWRILSTLHRHRIADRLWHHSRETRDEYSCIIHFIAPITRLPAELLRQIFLIIINETSRPPLALMCVCKHWHAIVITIWASLRLGTRTPMHTVTRTLRRNQWLLDIVVDMDHVDTDYMDTDSVDTDSVDTDFDDADFTPSDGAFEAIFAAMEASSRWRSLVVKSFPAQADLPEGLVKRCLQRCSNATMSRFTTFKIMSRCEPSPLLGRLLHILGTTAGSELTTVEINSANVISFLAPARPSMFHSIKVLALNTPGISNPVDLLPHLHQLETFTASHISFPIYDDDVHLPLIHTLRHLRLRAVSIQWMSGRTFHILEDCTLIFPLHPHVLHTFSTTLPNCTHLTFHGSPLDVLNGTSAGKCTRLSVTCPGSFGGRGSRQLLQLSSRFFGENQCAPRILHIGIEATNRAWINALTFMPYLEELVIESARPSSLGVKVFRSLIVQPVYASNLDTPSTPRKLHTPSCPQLKRLGLKYRRWLRQSEDFNLISAIESVISSRERSKYSLHSFSIWMTSNQDEPLGLIKESQMNRMGLQLLANAVETKRALSPRELGRRWERN